jgi:hypothetical protein
MRKIKTDAQFRRCGNTRKKTVVAHSAFAGRTSLSSESGFLFLQFSFRRCLNFACTPVRLISQNVAAPTSSNAEDKQASFQSELEKMRTANLQYIFVFRRKDGGAFDGEDKKYLRANLPFNNRVVLADEDKAVIVGSNYKFPPENLNGLQARFNVEDYSAAEQPAK